MVRFVSDRPLVRVWLSLPCSRGVLSGAPLLTVVSLLLVALLPGCDEGPVGAAEGRRAIFVSVDGLNEEILRRTLSPHEVPALYRLFEEASCAEHAVVAFPSSTASSHAVLWTGAYGDVNGVTGNVMHRLPRSEHTILETISGFSYEALSAEPLWVAAGRGGVSVAAHHPTQAPGVPGYPGVDEARVSVQEARRLEAAELLALPYVQAMNGYNLAIGPQRVVTSATVAEIPVSEWEGIEGLATTLPPRAFRWEAGRVGANPVHLHGLLYAEGDSYDAIRVSPRASVEASARARPHPVETASPERRELARRFSEPIVIPVDEGSVAIAVRLFELAPDGSDFLLFHPSLDFVEGSSRELERTYMEATGGWSGASYLSLYRTGAFGPSLLEGGDGTAEARFLESSEYVVRQYERGADWLWDEHEPQLLIDYLPIGDAVDHEILGYLWPEWPGFDAAAAEQMREFRSRVWRLVDLRMARWMEMADNEGAALFVVGDHGMRTSWRQVNPNGALRDAGLLVLDAEGGIDLSRTQAVSPNGLWISVNRTAWHGGIVPPEEEAEVIAQVRGALEQLTDEKGVRVIPRTFTPEENPEYGIGGPAGGDVYWSLAPGFRSTPGVEGDAISDVRMTTGHHFTPTDPDMYTVFCAWGEAFPGGRIPGVRTTVAAPTVAEYVGAPAPRDAVGGSVLDLLLAPER